MKKNNLADEKLSMEQISLDFEKAEQEFKKTAQKLSSIGTQVVKELNRKLDIFEITWLFGQILNLTLEELKEHFDEGFKRANKGKLKIPMRMFDFTSDLYKNTKIIKEISDGQLSEMLSASIHGRIIKEHF